MKNEGKDNFTLTILEESITDYVEKEKYYIKFFDSIKNGYNTLIGGNNPPIHKGEEAHFAKLTQIQVNEIKNLLKFNKELTASDIAKIYNCNYQSITRINTGIHWHDENEIYPLTNLPKGARLGEKNNNSKLTQFQIEEIRELLYTTTLTIKKIAEQYNCNPNTITRINRGDTWKDSNLQYPIRETQFTKK